MTKRAALSVKIRLYWLCLSCLLRRYTAVGALLDIRNSSRVHGLATKEVNSVSKHELLHIADEWLRLAQAPGIVPALNQLAILS